MWDAPRSAVSPSGYRPGPCSVSCSSGTYSAAADRVSKPCVDGLVGESSVPSSSESLPSTEGKRLLESPSSSGLEGRA